LSQVRTIWRDDITGLAMTKQGAASDGVALNDIAGYPIAYFANQPVSYTQIVDTSWPAFTGDGDWESWTESRKAIVTEGTEPYSAKCLEHIYEVGDYTGQTYNPGHTVHYLNSIKRTEIYLSIIFKKSSNFQEHPNGTCSPKVGFVGDVGTGGGGDPLMICWASNGKIAGFIQNSSSPPNDEMWQNVGTVAVSPGDWCELEVVAVMNTPGENYDGEYHQWVDSTKVCEYTDLWYSDAASPGWDFFSQKPLWGGSGGEITEEFYLYINHTRIAVKT